MAEITILTKTTQDGRAVVVTLDASGTISASVAGVVVGSGYGVPRLPARQHIVRDGVTLTHHIGPVALSGAEAEAIIRASSPGVDDAPAYVAPGACHLWTRDQGCVLHGESCREDRIRRGEVRA